MSAYERLERDSEKPKRVSRPLGQWRELQLLAETNGVAEERVRAFCADKHISFESLVELGTRVVSDRNGAVLLAWGYQANGIVTAVKFRELGEGGKRYAATPSVFLEPLVLGTPRLARLVPRRRRDGRLPAVGSGRRRRSGALPARRGAHVQAGLGGAHPARRNRPSLPRRRRRRRPGRRQSRRAARWPRRPRPAAGRVQRLVRVERRPRRIHRARRRRPRRQRAHLRVRADERLPRAPLPEGRAAARQPPGEIILAHRLVPARLRRRRLREEHLDGRRGRAYGRRPRLARRSGAAAGALLPDRERGAAGALPGEAGRESGELGRAARLAGQRLRLPRRPGASSASPTRPPATRSTSSATSTLSMSSSPTRRSASASPVPAAPTKRSSSSTGSSSAA